MALINSVQQQMKKVVQAVPNVDGSTGGGTLDPTGTNTTPPPTAPTPNTFGAGGAFGTVDAVTGLTQAGTNVLTGSPNTTGTTPMPKQTPQPNSTLPQPDTTPANIATPSGTPTNITTPNPAAPPAGIVGAAQGMPPPANPADIKPVMGTVSSDSLIEGRLTKLLGSDSPLIARARQKAAENATARGLQNSSMAVQAGEAAAIDAALPIATGDANTYARQDLTNQDSTNQFLGQDKTFAGQRLLAGEDRTFQGQQNEATRNAQMSIASMNASTQAGIAANELAGKLQLAGMDAQTRTTLAQMDLDGRAATTLAQLNQNSMVNFSNGFATIQQSSMEQDAKLNALKNYMAIWSGSPYLPLGIDLSKLPLSTTTTTTNTNGNGP